MWSTIYNKGNDLHFGSVEEPKEAKEIFAVVQIYGKALKDLYNGKIPNGWLFTEEKQKVYIEMLKDPERGEQPYTYGQRLHEYPVWDETVFKFENENYSTGELYYTEEFYGCEFVNQIENIREALKKSIETRIQTNRIVFVIWNPLDIKMKDPPCFNWGQLRLSEKNKVSLRTLFRSRDFGNASFANWGAIIRCFVDEVITPAGGILEELICVSASGHLYNNDFDMVESFLGKVPKFVRDAARA